MNITKDQVNPGALQVCQILTEHGHQAFIVGGCVRDLILGQTPKDWDITTSATPEQVIAIFPKTYPTGLQHGTITVSLGEGIQNTFEVTTFRVEGEYKDGRRPEEVFFVTNVEEDLSRRDLTINAIAYDPLTDRLVDPFGGIDDINSSIIKAVGNADERFKEDGLRIMRAARFSARFNYHIELNTFHSMKNSIATLTKVSKERIKDELCKTLMTKNPQIGLLAMLNSRALIVATPLLVQYCGGSYLLDQARCSGNLETRLAFLYRNATKEEIDSEMKSLKFSTKEINMVIFLHELFNNFEESYDQSPLEYRKFVSIIKNTGDGWKETFDQFIYLLDAMDCELQFTDSEAHTAFSRKEMAINGNYLMAIGFTPGPKLKKALDDCYKTIINEPSCNNLNYLLELSKSFI